MPKSKNPSDKRVEEVFETLYTKVKNGDYGEGFIPPHTQLKRDFSTSLQTIKEAIGLLRAMGLVVRQGKGLVANYQKVKVPALTESFDVFLRDQGLLPFQENVEAPVVIKLEHDVASQFQLKTGFEAVKRTRLQGAIVGTERVPYRIAETYYPKTIVTSEWMERLQNEPFFNLTKALKKDQGLEIAQFDLTSDIRFPLLKEQELLKTELRSPIYDVYRRCYASDGTLVMFNHLLLVSYHFIWEFHGPIKQF